jgi:hypothetical protein
VKTLLTPALAAALLVGCATTGEKVTTADGKVECRHTTGAAVTSIVTGPLLGLHEIPCVTEPPAESKIEKRDRVNSSGVGGTRW